MRSSVRPIVSECENLQPGSAQPAVSHVGIVPLESARERARELCVLGPAPGRFAIENATAAEQAACQQRLSQSTEPLGVERDEQGVTSDHADPFHTTGVGVVLNVGTHARRSP